MNYNLEQTQIALQIIAENAIKIVEIDESNLQESLSKCIYEETIGDFTVKVEPDFGITINTIEWTARVSMKYGMIHFNFVVIDYGKLHYFSSGTYLYEPEDKAKFTKEIADLEEAALEYNMKHA